MEESVMRQWKGKEQTSQQPFGPNDQPKILCTRIRTVPGAGVVVKVGKQVKGLKVGDEVKGLKRKRS
ncbi:2-methylene-furan-3-one reductase-like protein [Tanacetum coccineum]